MSTVSFLAPKSFVSTSFWEELYRRKLDVYGLSSDQIAIQGFLSPSEGGNTSALTVSKESYQVNEVRAMEVSVPGSILNVNTVEAFKEVDKKRLIEQVGSLVRDAIESGEYLTDPSILQRFVLLTFADLKAHIFTYWFAFPAFIPSSDTILCDANSKPQSLSSVLTPIEISKMYKDLSSIENTNRMPVYGMKLEDNIWKITSLNEAWTLHNNGHAGIKIITIDTAVVTGSTSASLDVTIGWGQRNLLYALSYSYQQSKTGDSCNVIEIIFLRGSALKRALMSIKKKADDLDDIDERNILLSSDHSIHITLDMASTECNFCTSKVVGWESNYRGKVGPRQADLSSLLNNEAIMERAVDLNLRLMRWRLWPTLDTEMLAQQKILLLGAGTLGCAVARGLLGWGIRDITFVDNGKVSYSNPARQCLFEFEDCTNRSYKAVAAAERLKKIFPGVRSSGYVLNIPMAGHEIVQNGEDPVVTMNSLINDHDVIFALTDSREARWLATVIAKARDKPIINVALGFDSYLVMRHGQESLSKEEKKSHRSSLGCYFCNDIVAPGNSMIDRSLDQQCTVTRPGLAFIAAGLAVEMMVAILHSKEKNRECAEDLMKPETDDEEDYRIPHQIRGSLTSFQTMLPCTPKFPSCTACGDAVVSAYVANPTEFTQQICSPEGPMLLSQISGVNKISETMEELDFSDDEQDDF